MHPDWLGSPQHFIAGLVLGVAIVVILPRLGVANPWIVAGLAVGGIMVAETLVELVEYPLLYSDSPSASNYFDTLADLANTLAGGVVGTAVGLLLRRRRGNG